MKLIKPLLLTLCLLLAHQSWAAQLLDRIVATVNDEPILQSELEEATFIALNQLRQQGITPPPRKQLERKVLDQLILKKIQQQRAKQRHIQVTDDEINHALSQLAARNGMTLDQLQVTLESQSPGAFAKLRKQVRDELMIEKLRQLEVINRINVTEQDVEQYLKQINGGPQKRYHLRHILIALPSAPTKVQVAEARAKAEQLRQQLNKGTDFAQLAVKHSQGQYALKGGDLGWRNEAALPDLFINALKNLQPGEISPVLKSPSGFHLLKLEDIQTTAPQQTAQAKQQALMTLRMRKANELFDLWLRRLRDQAHVEIFLDDPETLQP